MFAGGQLLFPHTHTHTQEKWVEKDIGTFVAQDNAPRETQRKSTSAYGDAIALIPAAAAVVVACILFYFILHTQYTHFGWKLHPFWQQEKESEKCTYCMKKGSSGTSIKVGKGKLGKGLPGNSVTFRGNYISRV